jgi:hypothetical protein
MLFLPFFLVFTVFGIYLFLILFSVWPIERTTLNNAGVFGDSFGLLTSLFSGLAFAGLLVTIWQQKEDLMLTRKEISDQHFENVLFKMLEIHNTIIMDIDLRKKNSSSKADGSIAGLVIASGRDCFSLFYKRLDETYQKNISEKNDESQYVKEIYMLFWKQHQKDLSHYFRYLYNIFKFIKDSDVESKKTYTNIVRAQLSDYELLLLFYNCISPNGEEKFKLMVEEYCLLDNLPEDKVLNKAHMDIFKKSAFGG